MTPASSVVTITPDTSLNELSTLFQETGHHGFVILEKNKLFGVVSMSDLEYAIANHRMDATAGEISTKNVMTAYPNENLDDALHRFYGWQ